MLIDLLPAAVYVCEAPSGIIVRYNRRAAELWGREPVAGATSERFCGGYRLYQTDGAPLPHPSTPMARVLQTGAPASDEEVVIERPDGSRVTVLVNIRALRDADGRIVGAVNVFQDISQRKRAEQALRQSELRFRRLLDRLPVAAYTCDREGLITYHNPRAVELWGRAPKLNHPEDRFCGSFRLLSRGGSPITHEQCWMALALRTGDEYNEQEIVIERPDGTRRFALAHANPIRDESGQVLGAVNILVDITDRKRLEAELRQHIERLAQADRHKDEFLATLAHELRNPLAPIRNSIYVLRKSASAGAPADRLYERIERQVNQMVRLVDDLLEVSRISSGKVELRRERADLGAVLCSAVETSQPLIEAAGHRLTVALPPEPLTLEADPVRLAQVISNLLNNAAKYTEQRGQIWLTARREGAHALVSVRDTGVGIPIEMLPRVFDMFAQVDRTLRRSQGGLGIGLSLARSLVQLHGGTIEARSDGPGHGSEFIVRLPLSSAAGRPEPGQTAARQDGGPASRCRILIVDDNRDAAETLGELLQLLGNDVRIVHDGPSAVREAQVYRPQVVLLDLGMPGMDGYEVARALRAQPDQRGVSLIALTGWGQEEDRRRTRETGFDYHLVKPVEPDALQALLTSLDAGRRAGGRSA